MWGPLARSRTPFGSPDDGGRVGICPRGGSPLEPTAPRRSCRHIPTSPGALRNASAFLLFSLPCFPSRSWPACRLDIALAGSASGECACERRRRLSPSVGRRGVATLGGGSSRLAWLSTALATGCLAHGRRVARVPWGALLGLAREDPWQGLAVEVDPSRTLCERRRTGRPL